MEPMTLGSPSGSPATSSSFLPPFLMGGQQTQIHSHNTLSPKSVMRNVSFNDALNSTPMPQDAVLDPRAKYDRMPTPLTGNEMLRGPGGNDRFGSTPQNYNVRAGPPTQDLFEALRNERAQVPTPSLSTPLANNDNNAGVSGVSQNMNQNVTLLNDSSYVSIGSFNSPMPRNNGGEDGILYTQFGTGTPVTMSTQGVARRSNFWVTVYGFPPSAASIILQHFGQCGTIVEKIFPPQNGNWVHLQFSSRLDCDKALNYNEKIIGNNIMVGVTVCKDKNIIDKENSSENVTPKMKRMRLLTHSSYKNSQADEVLVTSPNPPEKSIGLVNKAMDLFFGW